MAQEGSRRLKKVQECQRRKDSKRVKIYNCFLIDSWFGWVVNQEGYGMVALSTDWIVCSLNVGASESNEGLVYLYQAAYQICFVLDHGLFFCRVPLPLVACPGFLCHVMMHTHCMHHYIDHCTDNFIYLLIHHSFNILIMVINIENWQYGRRPQILNHL